MGLSGPLPVRVPAEVKELVLKTVDDAVAAGFARTWACALWQVSDSRVHRWRARRRDTGTLVDRARRPSHGDLAKPSAKPAATDPSAPGSNVSTTIAETRWPSRAATWWADSWPRIRQRGRVAGADPSASQEASLAVRPQA